MTQHYPTIPRSCLCCSKPFQAIGKFNRLCDPCKASNRAFYGLLADPIPRVSGIAKRQRRMVSWEEEAC